MALSETDRQTVVALEIDKAQHFLDQARMMTEKEMWDMAVNRYYYASFHIVQALLIRNGLVAKTHAGLIKTFAQHFILTGKIDRSHGSFLTRLMQMRQSADYNCSYSPTQRDIDMCVTQTPLFIEAVERLVKDTKSAEPGA